MKCSETRSPPLDQGYLRFLSEIASSKLPADGDASIPATRAAAANARRRRSLGDPPMHQTVDGFIAVRIGTLRLRVHYPSKERPLPALVYLHGGGWTLFDLNRHDRIRRVRRVDPLGGCRLDYPRAPRHVPGALEASVDAIEAFESVAPDWGSIGPTAGAIRRLLATPRLRPSLGRAYHATAREESLPHHARRSRAC